MFQIGWPIVAALGLILGSIVAILAVVPASDAQGRSVAMVIVNALVSILTGLFIARRVENAVTGDQQPEPEPEQPVYRPYRRPPGDDVVTWVDGETGRVSTNGDGLTPAERAALQRREETHGE